MQDQPPSLFKYDAAVLVTVLVWGLNFPILKGALAAMPPHTLNGFRFLVSGAVLGGLYLARGHHRRYPLLTALRDHGRAIVLLSLGGWVLYQVCFILGMDRTTAGNAALIMASSPLWTAIFGRLSRMELLPRRSWFALGVILIGTVIVVVGGAGDVRFSRTTLTGNVLILIASALVGGYTAYSRPILRHLPAITLTYFCILLALPFLLGLGLVNLAAVDWSLVNAEVWGAILYSGGLSTGLVYVFWSSAVHRVGASQTAVFGNLVPIVAIGASVVILGEGVRTAQVVGGLMIIGGLLVMRRTRRVAT